MGNEAQNNGLDWSAYLRAQASGDDTAQDAFLGIENVKGDALKARCVGFRDEIASAAPVVAAKEPQTLVDVFWFDKHATVGGLGGVGLANIAAVAGLHPKTMRKAIVCGSADWVRAVNYDGKVVAPSSVTTVASAHFATAPSSGGAYGAADKARRAEDQRARVAGWVTKL